MKLQLLETKRVKGRVNYAIFVNCKVLLIKQQTFQMKKKRFMFYNLMLFTMFKIMVSAYFNY